MATQNKEIKQKNLSPWDKEILTEAKAFMEGKYTRLRILAKEILDEYLDPRNGKSEAASEFLSEVVLPKDVTAQDVSRELLYSAEAQLSDQLT